MKKQLLFLSMAASVVVGFTSCGKSASEMTLKEIVEEYYVDRGFTLGASSKNSYLHEDSTLMDIWVNEFHYNTPENDFKQQTVFTEPEAVWNDTAYMAYINIAREKGQVIRAHCPISPQASKWICEDGRNNREMLDLMVKFAKRMYSDLEANSDVVKWMDVVNETIATKGIKGTGYYDQFDEDSFVYATSMWFGPRKGVNQWENPWTKLGFEDSYIEDEFISIPSYILISFELADRYAPSVKKIWNQDGDDIDFRVWDKIFQSIRYMRTKGLKIDGVAYQAHVKRGWEKNPKNLENLQLLIDKARFNKLEFHISELDVVYEGEINDLTPEERAKVREEQAATIGAITEVMLKNVGNGATALNFWTMADNRWQSGYTYGTLMEEDGTPLPAYHKVKELLLKYK